MKENYCEGCDCEFVTRQALDSHCCSEDGYAKDDGSGESDDGLAVAAVVSPGSVPVAVAVNATSVEAFAVGDGGAPPFSNPIQQLEEARLNILELEAGLAARAKQLEEARLNVIEPEERLAARGITADIMQRTLEERLARIQSSHSSDDPLDEDQADLSPR